MSCLFNSIGALIQRDPQKVRNEIVDFIIENKDIKLNDMKFEDWVIFSSEGTPDFDKYMKDMRNTSQWGSALEIISAVLLYNVKISVEFQNKVIHFGDDIIKKDRARLVLHYTGSHYTPKCIMET